jgi:hypothetical protein
MNDEPLFSFRGPWFSAREAAAYIPCKNVKAWYEWRRRHGIVPRANGSVAKADLDRALRVPGGRRGGGSTRNPNSIANLAKSPRRQAATTTDAAATTTL